RWNRVQHGGFHFKEPSCQHVLTDAADSLAACNKRTPGSLCHDEVDITLAVTQFLVGHAVKLVRQRAQRFGKQADGGGVNGQFTLSGLEDAAFYGDDVANIPALERGIDIFTNGIAIKKYLNAAGTILQSGEAGLAHDAFQHHATGNLDLFAEGFEF